MAKDKRSRKELLKKDDAFLSAASQGAQWISSNRTQVIIGVSVIVAAILGTWAVLQYLRTQDVQGSVLFSRGLEIMQGEVLPEGSEASPDPDAEPPTFETEEAKWRAAREQFEKVLKEAGASGVATLAQFFVADLSAKLDEHERAESGFLKLVDELSPRDSIYFLAVERAAYSQEQQGEIDAAIQTLAKLVNTKGQFYDGYALYHQARLYLEKGDEEQARRLLKQVRDDYSESPAVDEARQRLAMLGPETGGGEAKSSGLAEEGAPGGAQEEAGIEADEGEPEESDPAKEGQEGAGR